MRKRFSLAVALLVCCLAPRSLFAAPIVIDFDAIDELTDVTTQYAGTMFGNATVLTAGSTLNEFELPPHSGSNGVYDNGGSMFVSFVDPLFSVGGYFTYLAPITLEAFDSLNNSLGSVTSAFLSNLALSGASGSSPNEFLGVSSALGISSVRITGDPSGGSFVLDDLTLTPRDEPAPVPEPSSLLLLITGTGALAAVRRRFWTER